VQLFEENPMAKSQSNNEKSINHKQRVRSVHSARMAFLWLMILPFASFFCVVAFATDDGLPKFTVITVSPDEQSANALLPDWNQPRKPMQLSGTERQALIEEISGGGSGGVPLLNNIQTQGRTPSVRQLILSPKRPWYVHRAFLSSEGAQRVDARSVMHFNQSMPGKAVVGLNLIAGQAYLLDFLINGEGEGVYSIESSAGTQEFPDPDGERGHILVALQAEQSGWIELSLSRSAGSFDLHSVEVTLAVGSKEGIPGPAK